MEEVVFSIIVGTRRRPRLVKTYKHADNSAPRDNNVINDDADLAS